MAHLAWTDQVALQAAGDPDAFRAVATAAGAGLGTAVDAAAADGAQLPPEQLLERWREELGAVYAGRATHPVGVALTDAVRRYRLPQDVFLDLLRGVESDLRGETIESVIEGRAVTATELTRWRDEFIAGATARLSAV